MVLEKKGRTKSIRDGFPIEISVKTEEVDILFHCFFSFLFFVLRVSIVLECLLINLSPLFQYTHSAVTHDIPIGRAVGGRNNTDMTAYDPDMDIELDRKHNGLTSELDMA